MTKTYEEMYGEEKAKIIKEKISLAQQGINNSMYGKHFSEDAIKKMSNKHKNREGYWKGKERPDVKERMINNNPMKNKDYVKKSIEKRKRLEYEGKIKHLFGEENPSYKHGLSVGRKDYNYQFKESLKKKIKERDNYTCQECNNTENILSVHHIDYDKLNNSSYNLITLCLICHGKIQKNREHWKNYFQMKMFIRELFNPQSIVIFENNKLIGLSN